MSGFVAGAGLSPVSIVSRSPHKLDAFAVGLDGRVYTAAWEPGDPAWRGWWRIDGVEAAPGATVAVASRAADKLDVFVVGLDGVIHTAAWEPGDGNWRGWWPIPGLETTLHAPLAAVSRSQGKLDVVAVGLDGRVHTAAWEPGDEAWRGWWTVGDLMAPPGAPVGAVCRSQDKIDIFVVGSDGQVYTAAWESGDADWRGWWQVPGLTTAPRTPVVAVSRSADKLDVFATGTDGRVYSAAWEPGDAAWRGWWALPPLTTRTRTPITAVSRSEDKLDVFAAGSDGRVYTAAWEPGDTHWRGWWTVTDLVTEPGMGLGVCCRSADVLDVVAPGTDGRVYAAAWQQGESEWHGWWHVVDLVVGMTDPLVSAWKKVGVAFYEENTSYSEEAQGITTDGSAWFLSSNHANAIRKYDDAAGILAEIGVPQGSQGHVGAPGCFAGWLYVPIQGPHGVWKTPTDFSSHHFLAGEKGTDRFPWCDVNPLNGRLYTSEFDHWNNANGVLFAYDRETLARCPEDDIPLGATPIHFDRIQGGVFTRRGRVILTRSDPNGIFCFSALTGHCFGARYLGNFGSTGSEVEGVTVRPWQFDGVQAHVHVLELDNDWSSDDVPVIGGLLPGKQTLDDCYLHSFNVPEPDRL